MEINKETRIAVFGGGCFWCTEAIFNEIKGMISAVPGYSGGNLSNPTYERVCKGDTGYIEVVKIEYDPKIINYKDLLTIFFGTHDPTTKNKQGNDVGAQYQSVIFYSDKNQEKESIEYIKNIKNYGINAVTQVRPLENFYEAEDYQKNYYKNHKDQPYCQIVIDPKLKKLKEKFNDFLKKSSE